MSIMQARNTLFIVSPLIRQAIITSGALCASGDALANRLAALCEHFYLNRQTEQLTETAELLVSLPSPYAQAAGSFYQAMVSFRQRDLIKTARLLEATIRTEGAGKYKARAIQSLGIVHRFNGDDNEAFKLYGRAITAATGSRVDLITIVRAGINLSEFPSLEGDHARTLDQLRAIRPAVELAARINPFYAGLYCNEVAFELAQAGRIEEARRFAAFAVTSPFARAYPEWLETAQEIEQAREPIAAQKPILRVVVRPAKSRGLRRSSHTLFLIPKLALKASRRRLQPRTAIFTRELPRSRPTLEQVSLKIKIRAPSF